MFLDAELADAVIDIDLRVTHCKCRHHPHIIISALQRKYGEISLAPLDCKTEILARRQIRDLYI